MAKLAWDEIGKKLYETGVEKGVLYPLDDNNEYSLGVAWSGLSSVTKSPSGGEPTKIYADNTLYLTMYSLEELGGTIEAYMYPDEFEACNGIAEISEGVTVGQQTRKTFGFCYKSLIGNDTVGTDYGYEINLIYGCKVSPSEEQNQTVNESPEANTMSWEFTTTPVAVTGAKNTSLVVINSTKVPAAALKAIEDVLYGTENTEPRLPLPDEVKSIMKAAVQGE